MDISILASSSKGNCTAVSDGQSTILLDAGISHKDILKGIAYDISSVKGCFITHEHRDHCKGADKLSTLGVNVYASAGTLSHLTLPAHRAHTVKSGETVTAGSFSVYSFDVNHDADEPLGFVATSLKTGERLIYFTDTYYVKYKFRHLNYILGEINYSADVLKRNIEEGFVTEAFAQRLFRSHMSIETFTDYLQANDLSELKAVYILHMSDNNGDEKSFVDTVRGITGCPVYVGKA